MTNRVNVKQFPNLSYIKQSNQNKYTVKNIFITVANKASFKYAWSYVVANKHNKWNKEFSLSFK